MLEVKSVLAENFSITRGGPLYSLLARLGYAGNERRQAIGRTVAAVLLTWLPLLILSLIQGQAYGTQSTIPFLRDFAVNIRFLIAVPILILAESGIDQKWRLLVLQFLRSRLVDEKELPAFEAAIRRTTRWRDCVLPEVLLFIAAFFPSIFSNNAELLMGGVSNWHTLGAGLSKPSAAGWWFNLVSTPIFRFLLLRWIWRLFLGTCHLWRTSRINLYLVATHTDMAAGLGFLSQGQKAFSPIVFAGGMVVAGQVLNGIAYGGATLSSMKFPMIAYGVLATLLLIAPLLVVTPVLIKTKKKALMEYGAQVTIHNQLFDRKWIQEERPPAQVLLGNPDPSSLIDLGSSFLVIRQMGIVPLDRPTLVTLAIAAALPMVLVVLYATPTETLVGIVLKMLV